MLSNLHNAQDKLCHATSIFGTSRENEGTEREAEGVGRDMSCPLKLFLDERKSRFPAEVCFLRRPHAVLPRSQVLSEEEKMATHVDG